MADDWLQTWSNDDPVVNWADIIFRKLLTGSNQTILWLTEKIAASARVNNICFDCMDHSLDDGDPAGDEHLDWSPLLQQLETRKNLQSVAIENEPRGRLLPLWRNSFFQSLQLNENIRSATMGAVNFTENSDGCASFVESASNLTELTFYECLDNSEEKRIASAVQRNNRLQILDLERCSADFSCSIFQKLSSDESVSTLSKIAFDPSVETAKALRQYLRSSKATIRCLQLQNSYLDESEVLIIITNALVHSTVVNEVVFAGCRTANIDYDDDLLEEDEDGNAVSETPVQILGNLVTRTINLSTLRFHNCDFFQYHQFFDAVVELLVRRNSPLRCLDIAEYSRSYFKAELNDDFESLSMSTAYFRALMTAVSSSYRLEHFLIGGICFESRFVAQVAEHVQALLAAIPLFKVTQFTLMFEEESQEGQEERFIEAFRSNYIIQSIQCKIQESDAAWLSEANQARLDFYLDRNRKLAQWIKNPELIPRELWPDALMLALEAGVNSLYQSLLSLSGEEVGLRKSRKRKWPRGYDPS